MMSLWFLVKSKNFLSKKVKKYRKNIQPIAAMVENTKRRDLA